MTKQDEKLVKAGATVEQLRAEKAEFDALMAKGEGTAPPIKGEEPVPGIEGKGLKTKKERRREEKKAARKPHKALKRKARQDDGEEKGGGIRALTEAKVRYAEQGDISCNSDWLALALKEAYTTTEKKGKKTVKAFDLDGFTRCLRDNGVDLNAKCFRQRSPGWRGRYRMNGRQKLEIALAHSGKLVLNGKKAAPTGVFLKAMQKKHGTEPKAIKEES